MIWRALFGAVSKLLFSVAMLAASWFGGRKSAQADAKVKELKGYVETLQRMDEADIVGDDPAAARVFLEQRGKRDL
jgi:hypothetical protein